MMSVDELLKIIQKTNPDMTKELLIYELSQCRNKRAAVWILLESNEVAVYVDTLEKLGNEEIEKELM